MRARLQRGFRGVRGRRPGAVLRGAGGEAVSVIGVRECIYRGWFHQQAHAFDLNVFNKDFLSSSELEGRTKLYRYLDELHIDNGAVVWHAMSGLYF